MTRESLADAYRLAQFSIDVNVEDLTPEEARRVPEKGGNCIQWVLGHILHCRGVILEELGGESFLEESEAEPFRRGAPPLGPKDEAIGWDRLVEGLKRTAATLQEKLGALDEAALVRELPADAFPVRVDTPTLGTWLSVFLFHESYHAGQVGVLRRVIGKKGIIQ
jgi:uncharacterized damage-inducible protein DinB